MDDINIKCYNCLLIIFISNLSGFNKAERYLFSLNYKNTYLFSNNIFVNSNDEFKNRHLKNIK